MVQMHAGWNPVTLETALHPSSEMGDTHLDPDLLLAQSGWVRHLAMRLVGRDDVDDLVQDTFVTALGRPPLEGADERVLRAWLSRVVTNLAHLRRRGDVNRRAREERVARSKDAAGDPAVGLAGPSRTVIEAVMALDEPYRSTVLLRYFEGRSTENIAKATGASPAAVRKRLSRAMARIRERLDECHDGDRRAWMAALGTWLDVGLDVGHVSVPAASGAALTGGIALSAKSQLALIAVIALTTSIFLFTKIGPDTPPTKPLEAAPVSGSGTVAQTEPQNPALAERPVAHPRHRRDELIPNRRVLSL